MIKSLIKIIFRSDFVGKYAQFVLDIYNNDNNGKMSSNGEFNIIKKYIKNESVVFDVGANVGDWIQECIKISPQIKGHCFEPVKETFKKLEASNFSKNITLNNYALGEKESERTIIQYSGDTGLSSFHTRNLDTSHEIGNERVQITTLDLYCKKNNINQIDFLKIDVEGHEYKVLDGSKAMISQDKIKVIQFEYGQAYIDSRVFLKDIFELFNLEKYSFFKIYPNSIKKVDHYKYDIENLRYSNFLIIKK